MMDIGVGVAPRWWRGGASVFAVAMVVTACGPEVVFMSGSGGAGSGASGSVTSGTGGSGGSGGSAGSVPTASIGSGGGTSSTGGGGNVGTSSTASSGGQGLPCGIDCSTISTPDCTVAFCDESVGMCVIVNDVDGTACDDGLFCTTNDSCSSGTCFGGPPNDCGLSSPDSCQQVTCNEPSATCSIVPVPNGTACVSSNLCIVNPSCFNGTCQGPLNDCFFTPVPNECHVGQCDPTTGLCVAVPGNDGSSCIDINDLCTENKICLSGSCLGGSPKDCSALDQGCMAGACDSMTGQCIANQLPAGSMCPTLNDCTSGTCDNVGQCQATPANEGGLCNDGFSCTMGATCTMGVCSGGTGANIYFSEDFSDNAAGWTLGAEWQIGPAMQSMPNGGCGNGDPGQDHTATADNGLAGVVIGGNASTSPHPMVYLTSPPVDTSTVVGPLILSYQRWLNSDYTPFMQNNVEVFNGTSWVVVWQSGSIPGIQDAAWTGQSHDISMHKAPNMQVRFGFLTGNGAFQCSGWNLDDVTLADAPCN